MTFLGFNKQLDFQTLFTELGKYLAQSGDWYDERHTIQILFIAGLSLMALTASIILLWSIRKMPSSVKFASIGLCFLGVFIVVRAAIFHKVDRFFSQDEQGLRWDSVLELGGIFIIAVAGISYRRKASC